MNLTGQGIYIKSERSARRPNAAEIRHREKVRKLGCIIKNHECEGYTTIHHTGTGAGGRKNHKMVLPICVEHHLGDLGINSLSGKMSRREWETKYGTEAELLKQLETILKRKENL